MSTHFVQQSGSFTTWPVMSSGLSRLATPGSCAEMRCAVCGARRARGTSSSWQASAMTPAMPPDSEATATAPPCGLLPAASTAATAQSSSIRSTTMTPFWRRAPVITRYSPVIAPVCDRATRWLEAVRPIFISTMGLPRLSASSATRRKRAGSLKPSTKSANTSVAGSSSRYST
jgi:hypothetical protein